MEGGNFEHPKLLSCRPRYGRNIGENPSTLIFQVATLHIVTYLPYTFPNTFEYWLIPNYTWIIALSMVHNVLLFWAWICRLIHNGRGVDKAGQSGLHPAPSVLPTKRLKPSFCKFCAFIFIQLLEYSIQTDETQTRPCTNSHFLASYHLSIATEAVISWWFVSLPHMSSVVTL